MPRPPTPMPRPRGTSAISSEGNSRLFGILTDSGDPDFVVTPSGTRLPVTPKFKMSATARYSWPVGVGRAHVQAGIAYQGSAARRRPAQHRWRRASIPTIILGRLRLIDSGRPVRRVRLAEIQRRSIRHERLRRAQRAVALRCRAASATASPAHRARATADDRVEGRRQVLDGHHHQNAKGGVSAPPFSF